MSAKIEQYFNIFMRSAEIERKDGWGAIAAFDHRVGYHEKLPEGLTREDKLSIIPELQQLGFAIQVFSTDDQCPMIVRWVDWNPSDEELEDMEFAGEKFYQALSQPPGLTLPWPVRT